MSKKMGIEGVGIKIVIPLIISLLIIYFINRVNPEWFQYISDKNKLMPVFWVLVAIGVLFWIGSAIQLIIGWRNHKLITGGFYSIFLNPLYAAWVIFLLPAISLYLNSWLYLLSSVVFYIAMRKYVPEEEEYLQSSFGAEYEAYRKRVWFKV